MKKYVVITANILIPGLGSLIAGEWVRGCLQLLIAILGVLFWMTVALKLLTIPLIAMAWIWGIFTAVRYKRAADLDDLSPVTIAERESLRRRALQRSSSG